MLTPYNYGEIKSGKEYIDEHKERIGKVLHLADANDDGQISFTEFFFFVTVLQVNDSQMKNDFDQKGGKMTKDQFSKNMTAHRTKTKFGGAWLEKQKFDARRIQVSNQDFLDTNKLITDKVYKDKETLTFNDYLVIKTQLQEALLHYEFYQYDVIQEGGKEYISSEDFAKSLLIFLPFSKYNTYIKHIEKNLSLKDHKVSFGEFLAFHYFMEDIEELRNQVEMYAYIEKNIVKKSFDLFNVNFKKSFKKTISEATQVTDA